ncbi:MAG: allantoinase, partial [Bryocella sp.]
GLSTEVGSIEPGKHANLIAFDADATRTVTPQMLHYRHRISPYMDETLGGVVRSTWLRGTKVFDNDKFPVAPHGREYAVSCVLHHR